MTCTESLDAYAVADGMDEEEKQLMQQFVDLAKRRAEQTANDNGYGPNRTKAFVDNEMLKARNECHDRSLLRQIKEGLVNPEHAKAHNLDLDKIKSRG